MTVSPPPRSTLHVRTCRARRGFALLAVLWVVVGLAALTLAATTSARDALGAARNRRALTRAAWLAEGCAAAARAAADGAMRAVPDGGVPDPRRVWGALDRVAASPLWPTGIACEVSLSPAGVAVNLNVADAEQLRAALATQYVPASRADSMVDALLDWRDPDDDVRSGGAERTWYSARGRPVPRNGPLASVDELALVRGFEPSALSDSVRRLLFTSDAGRIDLNHAPTAVLHTLPGVGDEAAARLLEWRARGESLGEMAGWTGRLSREARAALESRLPELAGLVTTEPDAWTLHVRAWDGAPALSATIDERWERSGDRPVLVQRRVGP